MVRGGYARLVLGRGHDDEGRLVMGRLQISRVRGYEGHQHGRTTLENPWGRRAAPGGRPQGSSRFTRQPHFMSAEQDTFPDATRTGHRKAVSTMPGPTGWHRKRYAVLLLAGIVSLAACLVALSLGGGRPESTPAGLPDAGWVAGWGLRLTRLVVDLCAVMTVGSVLVGAVLLPQRFVSGQGSELASRRSMAGAGRWAAAWAVTAAIQSLFTLSDTAGVPPVQLTADIVGQLGSTQQVGLSAVMAAVAGIVAVVAPRVRSAAGGRFLLVLALVGLLPVALGGHVSSASDPDTAVSALVVHVFAASLWAGGLAAIWCYLRRTPEYLTPALARFSPLALAAFCALAASGMISAGSRLGSSVDAWTSGYAALVLAKGAVLVALGALGHRHRRQTLVLLARGVPRPFLRVASAELVAMGAAVGLASALSQTPGPSAILTDEDHSLQRSPLPLINDPVSLSRLATDWRPDAILLVVLGLALAAYLHGSRALVRRGVPWPARRTWAFVAGMALALIDLFSGVATYAPALLSVQMAQLLVALLLVPTLLSLGAPLSMWRQVRRPRLPSAGTEVLDRVLARPLIGGGLVCALLLGVYRTPVVELSLRSYWVHNAVLVAAMLAGWVLLASVLGIESFPRSPATADSVGALVAVAGILALLATELRVGDSLLAGLWFQELGWSWVDPVADQQVAALIAAVGAVGCIVPIVFIAVRAACTRH